MTSQKRSLISVGLFTLGIVAERLGSGATGWYGMAGFFLLALAVKVDIGSGQYSKDPEISSFRRAFVLVLFALGLFSLVASVVIWQER
ncbi:hypothetical protein J5837_00030 [Pseudoxanthomonas helianthi]|uniref:Uncharacterized protein n=1 Tax=Pseudoxanthomonas helianthi TaxID=1453541 RepID=A0A940WVR6_9GAMM|nr:hypothetical protein [Pseudoxanthomonas helianthi]MBP3982793.1 hypothetical protein [Pseudoxanthomonas helianthi]